jgi:uncharacterized protein YbjQ (UPF0145 family)
MIRILRLVGSLSFVLGLFTVIFVGVPWAIVVEDNPVVPVWLRAAVFGVLGGLLLVLLTVVLEQRRGWMPVEAPRLTSGDSQVLLLNSDAVPDRAVGEILGLVQGHTVFAIWLGNDLSALMRLIVGGELTEYTEMMGQARAIATDRMVARAEEKGADAIINVRYMTTGVVGTASELLAYGTAVKLAA